MKFSGDQARILMLGLDAAGKTTVVYKLKLNETVCTIATIRFNVETLEPIPAIVFTLWDMGGQKKNRALWKHYFLNTDGLVFVVDSADPERFQESWSELLPILEDDEMRGVPFLVMANKQGARRPALLVEKLGLMKIKRHLGHIQGCYAITGAELVEGLEIIAGLLKQFQNNK
ncbi:ADP-ribosylation factor-like [Pseudophryne corroboree]|uniref:ADP-ribosylation factor-like n=1 Tax=Pseudophryne corroboree TaxID=495146 RepID=UPI0030813B9D